MTDDVAMVIGTHLFSRTVNIDELTRRAHERGIRVVDDAAQALPVGKTPADAALFSFGRGKPIALGGGGAVLHRESTTAAEPPQSHGSFGLAATLRLADPRWFRIPQSLPFLGIGKTVYDPNFTLDGAPDRWQRRLGERQWERLEQTAQQRAALAVRFAARIKAPWAVPALDSMKAGPLRLPLLAPDRGRRDHFMQAMRRHGVAVSKMYPSTLAEIEALKPHLDGSTDCPGAEALAARLVTVPTYPSMSEADAARVERALESCL